MAPPTGLEPVTSWLTVMRSTDWAIEEQSWQWPIFPAKDQQVLSALKGLTSVFGMGTGVTTSLSSPDLYFWRSFLQNWITISLQTYNSFFKSLCSLAWINLRPISISQLNTSLYLHPWPINLVVFKGSYLFETMGNLILESVSRLDAFSVYPVRSQLSSCATGVTTGAP